MAENCAELETGSTDHLEVFFVAVLGTACSTGESVRSLVFLNTIILIVMHAKGRKTRCSESVVLRCTAVHRR